MDNIKLLESGMGAGGVGLAAGLGGLFGSWFGENGGFGGNSKAGDTVLLDSINSVNSNVAAVGRDTLQGQAQANLVASQGFNGINTSILSSGADTQNVLLQGFAGINQGIANSTATTGNLLTQGFAGVNQAVTSGDAATVSAVSQLGFGLQNSITSQGYESRLATAGLEAKLAECCCSIEKTVGMEGAATRAVVASEGAATRQLIQDNLITELRTQLASKDAKLAQADTLAQVTASQSAQTQQIINHFFAATKK